MLEGALNLCLLWALKMDGVLVHRYVLTISTHVEGGRRVEDDHASATRRRRDGQLTAEGDVAEEQGPSNHNSQVGHVGLT